MAIEEWSAASALALPVAPDLRRVQHATPAGEAMPYSLATTGNPDDGFTAVEIEIDGEYVGRVFELESGWYFHLQRPEDMLNPTCIQAVLAAKERLLHYVNRKGGDFREGMSRAAASLWLMQRDDGKGFTRRTE